MSDEPIRFIASDNQSEYVSPINIPTPRDFGSIIQSQVNCCRLALKLAAGSTSLFAKLETRGDYTPTSAAKYNLGVTTLEMVL